MEINPEKALELETGTGVVEDGKSVLTVLTKWDPEAEYAKMRAAYEQLLAGGGVYSFPQGPDIQICLRRKSPLMEAIVEVVITLTLQELELWQV